MSIRVIDPWAPSQRQNMRAALGPENKAPRQGQASADFLVSYGALEGYFPLPALVLPLPLASVASL
jgi:hypothetical protein